MATSIDPSQLAAGALFIIILGAISIIDARSMRIPNHLSLLLFAVGLAVRSGGGWPDLASSALSSTIALASFFLIRLTYCRLKGRDGLGLGDVKLFGAGAAWIPWQDLPPALLIASLTALFTRYSKGGKNDALKRWTASTLPTIQHHLDMANALFKG